MEEPPKHSQFPFSWSFLQQLCSNLKFVLKHCISQNTHLRKVVLGHLSKNLDVALLAKAFGFSLKTLQRAKKLKLPALKIGLKPPAKKVKCRVPQSKIDDATKILDALAPVKSGHNFRVVSCTLEYLYEQYRALLPQISPGETPVSCNFFP
jgi:hypothetical protein